MASPGAFAAGDEVEVRSDDDGFRGAWYEARVVRSMPKLGRCRIAYKTLMEDANPTRNLIETVDYADVRLRPPGFGGGQCFEIGEPVDAFHNDGWWEGVISRVLEEGGKRRWVVRFPEGEKGEELEFEAMSIRVHMEWINGKWFVPQWKDKCTILQNLKAMKSVACRQSLHEIAVAHNSEVPILNSIFSAENDKNPCKSHSSLLSLDGKNIDERTFKIQVESSHSYKKAVNEEAIPDNLQLDCLLMARARETSAVMEAGFEITTPVIAEGTNLQPKTLVDNYSCSESPRKESSAVSRGTVDNSPSNTPLRKTNHEAAMLHDSATSQKLVQHTPLHTIQPSIMEEEHTELEGLEYVNCLEKPNFNDSSFCSKVDIPWKRKKLVAAPRRGGKVPFHGGLRQPATEEKGGNKRDDLRNKRIINTVVPLEGIELKTKDDAVIDRDKLTVKKRARPRKVKKRARPRKVRIIDTKAQLERMDDTFIERDKQTAKKGGRPWKLRLIDTEASLEGTELNKLQEKDLIHEIEHAAEEVEIRVMDFGISHKDLLCHANGNMLGDNLNEANEPSNEGNHVSEETAAQKSSDAVEDSNVRINEIAKSAEKEAQAVALLPSGDHVLKRTDIEDRARTDHTSGRSPSKKTHVAFVKCSPLWKVIESWEVFSKMPQLPHFRPLEQFREGFREGKAIGLMVTFANLVDNVFKLRIVDSQDSFEEMMKTVADLKEYGFNVQHIHGLLEELRSIKGSQKQLVEKRSALEKIILERESKKDELDAKVEAINKVVGELEQSLKLFHDEKASIMKQKEYNDHEIIKLQCDVRAVENSTLIIECDFQGTRAAALQGFADAC